VACADIHRALGLSSDDLISRVLGRPDPSVSDAHSRYIGPYLGRLRPLAGAAELLQATAKLGLNVVLATSAKDEELDLMLAALGAGDAVGTVVSSGDVKQAKPDPEIVHKALADSGTDPQRAVMVGDTVWDVLAARRAGLPCIGLLTGGVGEEELRHAGAAETYRDPAAVLDRLADTAIGRLTAYSARR
jgi:phosphoglycolate phosphatase-like HAD superfamily hydrolase